LSPPRRKEYEIDQFGRNSIASSLRHLEEDIDRISDTESETRKPADVAQETHKTISHGRKSKNGTDSPFPFVARVSLIFLVFMRWKSGPVDEDATKPALAPWTYQTTAVFSDKVSIREVEVINGEKCRHYFSFTAVFSRSYSTLKAIP
jgi:hypothetical protein